MIKNFYFGSILISAAIMFITGEFVFSQEQKDIVNGNLIQFNDNGLWCWFQDERAIVDETNGKIIVGFDESQTGIGGSPRDGIIGTVIYDIKSGEHQKYQLWKTGCDDHNAPGFIIRPDGKYLAMYSQHYDYYKNRYRIFDGNIWSPEQAYDWTKRPGGTDYTIAYNNVYYLSSENRMYDFTRANHRTPNFIISSDMGDTWSFGGQLTTNTSNSYNKGYYKYWSNGVDRIDYIFTEQHPRDTLTSIYHGYIKGGKAYRSDGTVVDDDIMDTTYIPAYWNFTEVFANGTTIGDKTEYRCWQSDLMRYDDGTIAAIITARSNQSVSYGYPDNSINPQHDFIYCRYDGTSWSYTYLDKAGLKFYSSEADYVGLGALCPNDPNTLYISTPYDPRDTTINLGVREIFKGVTSDDGKTWSWTPITQNSSRDNVRPIVPAWNKDNTALLWCRGTYIAAQSFDAAVVGIIDSHLETEGKMIYVDASDSNTTLASGAPLVTTGPDPNAGAADGKWHIRTGEGNGGSILTSSEIGGENAPELKTNITLSESGTYDIWINFWGSTDADWRVEAGLSESTMQVYRQMACKSVMDGDHNTSLILTGTGNTYLYQAYLGRVEVSANDSINVFVDDYAIKTGTSSTLVGDVARTWYDGISYAKIENSVVPVELTNFTAKLNGNNVELNWETKTETNNQGFEIEKYNSDKWNSIGFIRGNGTTAEISKYSFVDKHISRNLVKYRIKQIDYDGSFKYSKTVEINTNYVSKYELSQNYPNPFNPVTTITYTIPKNGFVELKVYNSLGQEVAVLVNKEMQAGSYQITWNAQNEPSGIYFYKITFNDFSRVNKMVLLK